MKKTLHGKRHIRARATVQIGRQNRRFHKMQQEIKAFRRFIKAMPLIVPKIIKSFQIMVDTIVNFVNGPYFKELAEKMNNELPKTKSPS